MSPPTTRATTPATNLDEYAHIEALHVGARALIARARRVDDGRPVVLKRLAAAFPSVAELAQLRREHDLARACAGPGVIAVRGVHTREGVAWIEMEDFSGASLASRYAAERPSVREALEVARGLVDALEQVHRAGIVHKDVCPANVLVSDDLRALRLIDFGVASATPLQSALRVDRLEGTPAYMSPEQTGRMNRSLDWRADYYSLGATLHFLLTGEAPFAGRDPLEVVHAHIARRPPSVRARAPEVPEVVASIVATLLEKRAEDRYQSAAGLRRDLDRCIAALRESDAVEDFPLRVADRAETLRIPDTLYGRGDAVAVLDAAIARVAQGSTEAVFVTGAAGVGKTSVVGEVRRGAATQRAVLVSGKFEQFQRDVPYAALLAGLRGLLRTLLALDAAPLAPWRARLAAGLGDRGGVLVEALPELELLLGALPRPQGLSASEAEKRYLHALVGLIGALPDGDAPAVLLLDDLQWADPSTFALVESLLTDPALRGVLVLGAWRANEVDDTHALSRTLKRAASFGARVSRVELAPLEALDVIALLRDTLGRGDDAVAPLARLVHVWTGGNPFLVHRAIEGLRDAGLLRRVDDGWRWDLDEITRSGLGGDSAGYVAGRLADLPPPTRRCLEAASCFAGRFREGDLAAVLGTSRRALRADLTPALELRLVHPQQHDWWPDESLDVDFSFAFSHDRVLEAARARLDAAEAEALHLRIGRLLRARGDADVFDVVHHLNLASSRLDAGEREALCGLDAEAGRRALRSGAFAVAQHLLDQSVALLPPAAWADAREDAFALLLDAARAASLAGRADRVDVHVSQALSRAAGAVERSAALEIRALDRAGRDILGAIDLALDAIEDLGVRVPRRPTMPDVEAALGAATGAVLSRDPDAVVGLPELADPGALAVLRLANAIFAPSYLAAPLLMPILAAVIVEQTLARGAAPQSTYGFAILSVVLTAGGVLGPGHQVAQLALRLMERFRERAVDVRSAHVVWGFVMPFTIPIRDAVEAHRAYHASAMAAGDHEYAAWISHLALANAFYAGTALDVMAEDLERESRAMRRLGQRAPLDCTEPFRRHVRALQGLTSRFGSMDEGDYSEEGEIASLIASGSRGAVYVLQAQRMQLRFLARDPAGVLAAADAGDPYADGASCTYHIVLFHQTLALACAALAEAADGGAREALLARAARHRAQLDVPAAHAPHNHRHRVCLIDAELARVRGDVLGAMDLYDASIAAARENGFVHEEALASELAARHHLARGRVTVARAYLAESCVAWARWGAAAKLQQLEAEFPQLVPRGASPDARAGTVVLGDAELDLATLSKATLAITGEIRSDRLVERVLAVSMENAGATRGMLLLERDGALRLEAAQGDDVPARGTPLKALTGVPARVIQYVARTGEATVLSDARRDARFSAGAATSARPLSVLALPLAWKGRTSGMIYLENDLTADAFTAARRRLQELLGAQAAISLENARLYDEAEALVRSSARFVPTEFLAQLGRRRLVDVVPGDAAALDMTVLFTDLRGFTGLTERLGPAQTFALLNAWLSRVTEVIARRGGFVQDIVGDATLALFPGTADDAVRAAVELAAIPAALCGEGLTPVLLRVGIGLNAGPVTLGTLGSAQRLAIAVVGDTVNTAARLETATKGLATQALVSQGLVDRLRAPSSFALRPLGPVALHGRAEPVAVCELLDLYPPAERAAMVAALPRFAEALAALRAGDLATASARLDACVAACPDDALARALLERLRRGGGLGGKDDVEIR